MAKAYIADVGALEDEALYRTAYGMMPEERKSKTDRYRFKKDKLLSVGVWALLCIALEKEGIGAKGVSFAKNADGKPYIEGAEICFNLSHSGTKVLCAVSEKELGCDVEKIKTADMGIAGRFFHKSEIAALEGMSDEPARDKLFFRLWTLKESYIKATGRGLREKLSSFEICFKDKILAKTECGISDFCFAEYTGAPGYAISVCTLDAKTEFVPICLEKEVWLWENLQ